MSVCLDASPSSSILVRTSTSSTSPNLPNRSFRSFWVTVWLNPPTYSRLIAPLPRQHYTGKILMYILHIPHFSFQPLQLKNRYTFLLSNILHVLSLTYTILFFLLILP